MVTIESSKIDKIVTEEIEYLTWCVQHGIITVDEYLEIDQCYLYPLIKIKLKRYEKQIRK